MRYLKLFSLNLIIFFYFTQSKCYYFNCFRITYYRQEMTFYKYSLSTRSRTYSKLCLVKIYDWLISRRFLCNSTKEC